MESDDDDDDDDEDGDDDNDGGGDDVCDGDVGNDGNDVGDDVSDDDDTHEKVPNLPIVAWDTEKENTTYDDRRELPVKKKENSMSK